MKSLSRGVLAGLAGTAIVQLLEHGERRILGRPPVFAPGQLVRRLARRWLGAHVPRQSRGRTALLMRWSYGSVWGAGYALARPRLAGPSVAAGLELGACVAAFELVALPVVGATPSLARWSPREVALLIAQTLAFGLTVAMTDEQLTQRRTLAPEAETRKRPVPAHVATSGIPETPRSGPVAPA